MHNAGSIFFQKGEDVRNPDRLYSFYDSLREIHMENFPDWRFGQMIHNFRNWLIEVKGVDCFFPEESDMIDYFKEFAEYVKPKRKKGGRQRE